MLLHWQRLPQTGRRRERSESSLMLLWPVRPDIQMPGMLWATDSISALCKSHGHTP